MRIYFVPFSHTRYYPAYVFFLLLWLPAAAGAQSFSDSTLRRSIVKLDLTNAVWYRNAFSISYEHLIKPNQTAAFTIGTHELMGLANRLSNEALEASHKKASGYRLGAEYRFYLQKENRYRGAHGVYVGPYAAYHRFENEWNITYRTTGGNLQTGGVNGSINVLNMGIQAGYQFLIGNRWSVDMTFIGGSISSYRARMEVTGNFDIDDSEINQELLDALYNRFPLLENLVNDKEIDTNGRLDTWGLGYRYILQVGYAFGKKKVSHTKGAP